MERGAVAAGAALLMALSMVIAESLVARTFATYVLAAVRHHGRAARARSSRLP